MQAICRGTEYVSVYNTLKSVNKKVKRTLDTDVQTNRCTADADAVRSGDVYFALPQEYEDIEEAVGLAVHNGCAAVVTQVPVHGNYSVPVFSVPNVKECYAAFCQALYDFPSKSLKMIGITGTSGKTSTSYLLYGILSAAGYQTGLISSLGIFDGTDYHSIPDGELPAEELAVQLSRMVMNGCTHVIIETSSRCLAEGLLGGIQFDAVCLTNIRRDHVDYHQTVEKYRRAKLGIFKYAKKKALAVCNTDDRITEAVIALIQQPTLTVGIQHHAADVSAKLVERCSCEQTFIISAGTETAAVQTKVIGDEHIYNCLTAAALAIGFEIDLKTIVRGIERVENIPGRMERLEHEQAGNYNVFLDSAGTADSLSAVLRAVREVTSGRLLCVFCTQEEHDYAGYTALAKILETQADSVILTTADDSDDQAVEAVCCIGGNFKNVYGANVIPHRADAINWTLTEAEDGDSVIIVGGGDVPMCDTKFFEEPASSFAA